MRKDNLLRFAALFVAAFAGCAVVFASIASAEEPKREPITMELITLIENNPEIGVLLQESIDKAAKANPDPATNPIQNLEDYYNYVDRVSKALPQDVLLSYGYKPVSEQMVQGLCYCLFVVSQPLEELEGKGLCDNTLQFYEPFASWYRHFAVTWGQYLCTEDSWSEGIYREVYDDEKFGLQGDWYEDHGNWHTFNRFFSRYLSSYDKKDGPRPIASLDDPTVVVSPADSVPQEGPENSVWPIDSESNIAVKSGKAEDTALEVKRLFRYYSVHDLLSADSKYKDAFAGGVLTHTFLNVYDYHRYHFAVGGTVVEKAKVIRNAALDGIEWDKGAGEYTHKDELGYQFSQTLGYVIVDTGEFGLVALIPMGMSQVSSVNFEDSVKVGAEVKKGDMLGYFLFGGSDFVMLFQEKAGFEYDPKVDEDGHILMGGVYGIMAGPAE